MSFSAHYLFAVLLTILSLPSSLWAQSALKDTTKAPRGSVSGRVTLKDKGVFGVAVALRKNDSPNEQVPRAMTDQDGYYRIANVAPGTYDVSPSVPAFVPSDPREQRGKTVLIGEDENVENINFTLVRGGVITGRVTDADGRPVIQQQVFLYRADAFEQRRAGQQPQVYAAGGAQTDDRGIYRVYGIWPGRYKVASGRSENVFTSSLGAGRSSYTQVFHPDETDPGKAPVIEVGEGTEATNIDITLGRALQTFTMMGRVVDGEKGSPIANVRIALRRQVGQRSEFLNPVSISNLKGDFVANGLIPGKYNVVLFSNDYSSGMRAEPLTFEIIDQDVSGIIVKLVPGASLSGVVVLETENRAAVANFSDFQLHAFVANANGGTVGASVSSPVGPNGSFLLAGLPGGLVNVQLGSMTNPYPPKGFSIVRLERDGVVMSRGIPIQEREQLTGVRVVLSYGSGTIRGVVEVENGTMPSGARIFVSFMKQGQRGANLRPPPVDARGRFLIEGVSPGTYELQPSITGGSQRVFQGLKREVIVQDGITTDIKLTIDMNPSEKP